MGEILPNNTIQGYFAKCPICKDEISVNIQGTPINHDCKSKKCMERNCENDPVVDYNGHGYWVCGKHYDILSDEFDENYK